MYYLIGFLIEIVFLGIIEKRHWGTWITPLNVLSVPYALSVITIILYRKFVPDIPEFYYPSLIIWMFGLLLFEFPSIVKSRSISSLPKRKYINILITDSDDSYKLLRNIAYFSIIISLIKIRNLSGALSSFGSDSFSAQYQSSSIYNHLSVLVSCIFSYAIYKYDSNHKTSIIIIVGSLIGMFAIGTKSWIIAPFLIGYYARLLTGKLKLSFKTTIFPILIIFIIFFTSYYISLVFLVEGELSNEILSFIGNHFVDYFCSGALTLGIDYKMGFVEPDMTSALFAPPLNIFNALFGFDYIYTINPIFIDIGVLGTSNVRTFFGTIAAYSKSIIVFVIITSILSYFIYSIYAKACKSNSIFLLLANSANLTFLTFGFFDFYWLTLSSYEIPALFLIMHYFLYIKQIRRNKERLIS